MMAPATHVWNHSQCPNMKICGHSFCMLKEPVKNSNTITAITQGSQLVPHLMVGRASQDSRRNDGACTLCLEALLPNVCGHSFLYAQEIYEKH